MAVVINTNVDSLRIQNILSGSTDKLAKSMQHMSTGLKINEARDDAAGTVISARMQVQLDGNKICQNNVQNANAMLSTAEGNIDVVLDNITRIRDLTLQAKNGTYSSDEIKAMQDEVTQRMDEIDRVSKSAKYSHLKLFGDEEASGLAVVGAKFQVGPNATENDTITANADLFKRITFTALTAYANKSDFNLQTFDATAKDDAVSKLDNAITLLTDRKSTIGSLENRLESALDTLTTQNTNLSSAKSIITDADVASEASTFTQQQILQQVSTSLLVQANQAPGIALSLI